MTMKPYDDRLRGDQEATACFEGGALGGRQRGAPTISRHHSRVNPVMIRHVNARQARLQIRTDVGASCRFTFARVTSHVTPTI